MYLCLDTINIYRIGHGCGKHRDLSVARNWFVIMRHWWKHDSFILWQACSKTVLSLTFLFSVFLWTKFGKASSIKVKSIDRKTDGLGMITIIFAANSYLQVIQWSRNQSKEMFELDDNSPFQTVMFPCLKSYGALFQLFIFLLYFRTRSVNFKLLVVEIC